MAAERDAMDRYVAAFLEDRVGATFDGRITGVTRFGLFVRLEETGADGLVPVSSLGDEYFTHDDRAHALVGERTGQRYTLGRRSRSCSRRPPRSPAACCSKCCRTRSRAIPTPPPPATASAPAIAAPAAAARPSEAPAVRAVPSLREAASLPED
jgi:hypothetical protein